MKATLLAPFSPFPVLLSPRAPSMWRVTGTWAGNGEQGGVVRRENLQLPLSRAKQYQERRGEGPQGSDKASRRGPSPAGPSSTAAGRPPTPPWQASF